VGTVFVAVASPLGDAVRVQVHGFALHRAQRAARTALDMLRRRSPDCRWIPAMDSR
jgi:hypothetical protein